MIKPTVGRVVWFTPPNAYPVPPDFKIVGTAQPCAALVTYVWGDRLVNLTVSDHYGKTFGFTSVALLQDDDARPLAGYFCEWMPYQVGQAKAVGAIVGGGGSTGAVGSGHVGAGLNAGPSSDGFSQYRRTEIAELRPYVPGEDMREISLSSEDKRAGSPKVGDMVARNPKNRADKWLVAAQYASDNFALII